MLTTKEVSVDLLLEAVAGPLQATFKDSAALKEFTDALYKEKKPFFGTEEHC